ncbi:AbrB family transcriptional regulator [Roseomonas sp. GC11]|uniref:AbrB family transcriptional regulator n=1 Tax=Roseomonas sp. GC11 TaxID=2950546 RepID=UPI00210A061B|nr:AbrB family transcriptional regulator [Roseomonas sp. GC11]MCQ4162950.1 AbrB family transcriptional regulator [Roseomonas sp. GC11]
MQRLLPYLLCLALAAPGGALFAWLHTPLPWLLGAMTATAAGQLCGLGLRAWRPARNAALLLIGAALGLFFTPEAGRHLAEHAALVLGAALATLAIGVLLSPLLARLGRLDRPTALFGSIPGGVAEMSVLGESYGARPIPVAVIQMLRVVGVVVILPSAFAALGITGQIPAAALARPLWWPGLALMLALGGACTWVLIRLNIRNAWLLGALFVSLGLTASGHELSGIPPWMTAAAQLCMGAALGAQFERRAFRGGTRLLLAAVLHVLLLTALCAVLALGLSWGAELGLATLILATAPGGVAEMSLTAKTLALDVPIVVAFHLVRIALTAVLVQPCAELLRRGGYL